MSEFDAEQKTIGGIPVDPRVQWAMDIMENDDHDYQPWYEKIIMPAFAVSILPVSVLMSNFTRKVPTRTNMPLALATTPLSLAAIFKLQEVKNTINRENIAHAKHYILTHPERFPEPKKPYFKDMILPYINRRWS